MRILIPITYFSPNISGLSEYAKRLALLLHSLGHEVSVLTSQLNDNLPLYERVNGFHVYRVPITFRYDKFVLCWRYREKLEQLILQQDLILAQLPLMPQEALVLEAAAKRFHVPLLVVYQCDLKRTGFLGSCAKNILGTVHKRLCKLASRILVLTLDYANASETLQPYLAKCVEIPPLVEIVPATNEQVARMREKLVLPHERLIGCVARFSQEKGIEYLLESIPLLEAVGINCKLAFVGDERKVIGDAKYRSILQPLLDKYRDKIVLTGKLSVTELSAFYAACDCTVLPSLNATESFGLVQLESGLCGTPVVASNLAGVRQFIVRTGMGVLVPVADKQALVTAISDVLNRRSSFVCPREKIIRAFSLDTAAQLFSGLLSPWEQAARKKKIDTAAALLRHAPAFTALVRSAELSLLEARGALQTPVLDVGCGEGDFSRYAFEEENVYHIDPDPVVLRKAKASFPLRNFIEADCCKLLFSDAFFPTIVCNSVLEHILQLESALGEIARVLKPGGSLYVTVPTSHFAELLFFPRFFRRCKWESAALGYERWFNKRSRHFHTYSPELWREKFQAAGLQVRESVPYLNPRSHLCFDICHYLSLPRLASKYFTGSWVLSPKLSLNPLYEHFFSLLSKPKATSGVEKSPYVFFSLTK